MLRRFWGITAVAVLLFNLSACADINVPFELKAFTAQVTIKNMATEIKGELTYNSPEDITFKVRSPENIRGMTFRSVSQSMSVSVGEVSFTADGSKDSPVYMLFTLLEDIAHSDIVIPSGGEKEISLLCDGKNCRVKINCESKKIAFIEAEKYSYIFE